MPSLVSCGKLCYTPITCKKLMCYSPCFRRAYSLGGKIDAPNFSPHLLGYEILPGFE